MKTPSLCEIQKIAIDKLSSILDDKALFSHFSDGVLSQKYIVLPGFVDVHVHLREPGFIYKESILSGSLAAARGGYCAVMSMPNLNPVPDSLENLNCQLEVIKKDAKISVYPYGSITVGQKGEELSNMDEMAPFVAGFSDDGRGVQDRELMKKAMLKAKSLNKIIVAHCEDNSLLNGGYIHAGKYAEKFGHKGIVSESEWGPIKRDIELVRETGVNYHVCHISCKESVELIREAKAEGLPITCETAPHYLILNDMDISNEGRFKMNPPIRSEEDRQELIRGICDGTIDMIATDHAPHSEEEKSRGLEKSLMGVVGIETAFPLIYTNFVRTGFITLKRALELFSYNAHERFNLRDADNSFSIWDLEDDYRIDPSQFLSKGRSTPFENERVFGKCLLTVADGKIAYKL